MQLSLVQMDDRVLALEQARADAPARVRSQFDDRFMQCVLYHELSLEGVVLTEYDLKRALQGLSGLDYCDNELLKTVRRYYKAVGRLHQAVLNREPVSLRLLLHYQEILKADKRGSIFRTEEGATGNYKHDTTMPADVEAEFNALLDFVNQGMVTMHPVELSVEVHYRFVKLWPFDENSALLARLVSNQVLLSAGYPPTLIHAHDRQKYYHAFHYDISRIRELLLESIEGQFEFRERVFGAYVDRTSAMVA